MVAEDRSRSDCCGPRVVVGNASNADGRRYAVRQLWKLVWCRTKAKSCVRSIRHRKLNRGTVTAFLMRSFGSVMDHPASFPPKNRISGEPIATRHVSTTNEYDLDCAARSALCINSAIGRCFLVVSVATSTPTNFLFAHLLLNHVDMGENAAPRDRPSLRKNRNNATTETMMQLECADVALEGVGEHCERELCRPSIAFAPCKAARRMFMQIETGIERTLSFALAYSHQTESLRQNRKSRPCSTDLIEGTEIFVLPPAGTTFCHPARSHALATD